MHTPTKEIGYIAIKLNETCRASGIHDLYMEFEPDDQGHLADY